MTMTLILSIMMMAGMFLMLLGGVGFIRDKNSFHQLRGRSWQSFRNLNLRGSAGSTFWDG